MSEKCQGLPEEIKEEEEEVVGKMITRNMTSIIHICYKDDTILCLCLVVWFSTLFF